MTILGAPGSGKGFYGKPIATAWKVDLLTSSRILRAQTNVDLDSGQLVDCQTVCNTLLEYLQSNISQGQHYMMDGFPRTLQQIQIMKERWPPHYQIHAAVHLDIPDFVCQAKMLGRRHCPICHQDFNIAGVYRDGFDLPQQMPTSCDQCRLEPDWTRRPDDTYEIVQERLRLHHKHEQPILDYYKDQNRLLQLTPYRGDKDIPYLQSSMEDWLQSLDD